MERFCRGCLIRYDDPAELLEYTEKNRRLFVYCTGIQVKRNDTFTFQLCKDCYINMKQACKFKKLCRTSDKKFKTYSSLKEIGEAVDLCTYLKNNDDMLRFPTFAANSTPRNQKNKDGIDDLDESTCTSIGNFMKDILQGTEMPDIEARIIRQVIEEEADVLDDSLDSHWLQDDASIDTDFRLDFSFSPFSTPRSVTNDHCYTPSRLCTPSKLPDEVQHKYVELPKIAVHKPKDDHFACNEISDKESNETNTIVTTKNMIIDKHIGTDFETEQNDINLGKAMLDVDKEFNHETNIINLYENQLTQKQISTDLETEQCNTNFKKSLLNGTKDFNQEINITIIGGNQLTQNQICADFDNEEIDVNLKKGNDKVNEDLSVDIFNTEIIDTSHHNIEDNLIILQVDNVSEEQVTKVNNKNYYVDNLLLSESVNDDKLEGNFLVDNQKELPLVQQNVPPVVIIDSIDKNLQNALKGNKEKFALEDLLASPAVIPSADVLSTPSIHNLIFGNMSDKENHDMVNLEKNISVKKSDTVFGNKIEDSDMFKDGLDEFKNTKLGSVSSIEKILFGEKLDEDSTIEKQYSVDDLILETKIHDVLDNNLDSVEKNIFGEKFGDSKTDEKMEIEGNYIEVLDEFFNSRDIKQGSYSENESQDLIIDSGTRYDDKTCEELYDFEECYCKLCKKKFKTLKALRIHSVKIHKILLERSKFRASKRICEICGVTIKDSRNFMRHIEIHMLEGDQKVEFKCDQCVLSFKQKHHLDKHKLTHSRLAMKPVVKKTTKKHICPVCGLLLATPSALKIHQRIHTREFSDYCIECGKGFYNNYNLKVHMRTHTGERPYECPYCSKGFIRSNNLNKHMFTHTGEKRFECDHCNRTFPRKETIINHITKKICPMLRKRTKQIFEKYKCQFCHATVSGVIGLQAHQRLSKKCHIKRYNLEPKTTDLYVQNK